jgi:hypothetical protein
MKIIIWGYPLYSHTYSYIHAAFYKAFKFLGYDVYWFNDEQFPVDFSWDNCVFLTEGFADKNIPLKKTCTYLVHGPPDPKKYLSINPKKFVDLRYNHVWMKDHIYEYTLDKTNVEHVGKSCYFQKKENRIIHFKNDYHEYDIEDYDKFYISWATNLLPAEINLDDVYYSRKNEIWYCGSIVSDIRWENYSVYKPFIEECNKLKIPFHINNPFQNPLSDEEVIKKTKDSLIGIDLRGPEHLRNGYLPCRVMKNISYGHLGTTNSFEVYKELEGNCLYEKDPVEILYKTLEEKNNFSFIKNTMIYVKENHTYINRINSLLKIL